MVHLVKHDLEFILKQVKVAEENSVAHSGSAAKPLTDLISHHLLPYGLRTVNGSYNNLIPGHEWSGAADQIMPRLTDPYYVEGEAMPAGLHGPNSPAGTTPTHYGNKGTVYDSDPRVISNLISDQTIGNPATIISALTNLGHADPYKVLATGTNMAVYQAAVSAYKACEAAEKALVNATANVTAKQMALARLPQVATEEQRQAALDALDVANAAKTLAQEAVGPATEAKDAAYTAMQEALGIEMEGDTVVIPNVSADLGDTAPFNGFFTLFGQFFDHGLDLVSKGGNGAGTVFIPLQPDDPLYVPGSPTNFMVVTRATPIMGAGQDGQMGTSDDVLFGHRNETTPWIDLNQVYTSNPSHQVFLREYALVDGKPVATGRMLEGANGGPATWADVKQQAAEKLGIILTDADILRVPALLTDLYGEFVRGTNGFPQLVTANGAVEGNPEAPVAASQAVSAGRAFLNDIAHTAAPVLRDHDGDATTPPVLMPDADDVANGGPIPTDNRGNNLFYDNELLDKHVIVGDGRGNENIGLTSIHHVFHHEHNRMIEETKKIALESSDLTFLNEWLAVDVTAMPTAQDEIDNLVWDGERLFQAARFSTEMVYQHLVFEEFARAIAPDVDPFVFSNTTVVDGAIVAEFAHVVYRFGHSMLTDSIDLISMNPDGTASESEMGLIEAFLNPVAFAGAGVDAEDAAGAILRGMTRQVGNEIDEHLTDALRNNLVGLPLDLGATNIARARETGVPSLNEARRQFYADTHDSRVKPYESWHDFALSLKNPASLINFIAAYGTHASIKAANTVEDKRDAAMKLIFGDNSLSDADSAAFEADRMAFLHGQGQYGDTATGKLGGLNDVDFWIGGLAEKKMTFGSMLGSSFTYVFEFQMENLQAGDRFYYLSRAQGLNLLNELEADSFAQLIMRNTSLGDGNSTHVNGAAFQTADHILEMDRTKQIGADPTHSNPILQAISPMVIRKDVDGDGNDDYLRYTGSNHVVLGGTNRGETLIGGEGDDTLWGDGGNDSLEGGYGVDHLHGGDGDDIITDSGTDIGAADVIHGDAGNDVINPGSGLDLVFGGSGQDFVYGGTEAKDVTGGLGNDFVRGGTGVNFIKGNEGDDWLEGGDSFDTLAGENSELFFNSTIIGHDVLNGRGNDNDYDAESGDDIMFQNEGIERNNGMAGFDWAIHKGHNQAADSDMTVTIFQNQQNNILRDRFDLVEGLSGWKYNDKLTGREVVMGAFDANGNATQVEPGAPLESYSNALLEKNLHLIDGLADLVAHLQRFTVTGADGKTETVVMQTGDGSGNASDILLGGGGSDTIQGNAGDDIIDGDKWLNVRIRITVENPAGGTTIYTADGLDSKIYREVDYVNGEVVGGAVAQFGGRTLQQTMFDRTLNPGQLSIVREIVDGGQDSDVDVAVYTDVMANYTVTRNEDGSITVEHNVDQGTDVPVPGEVGVRSDGTDRLTNIEVIRFSDGEIRFQKPELSLHAFDSGQYLDQFGQAAYTNSNGVTPWTSAWQEASDPTTNPATTGAIRITNGALQLGENGGDGASIQRSLNLDGATAARLSYSVSQNILNRLDAGEQVRVMFSTDGLTFTQVDTITGTTADGNRFIDLAGPFGPNAAIRFETTALNWNGLFSEYVRVDNVSVAFTKPAATPSVHYATTYTEGSPAVAIANLPGIVDNDAQLASARIVLTNKKDGDALVVGTLPAGITAAVNTSVVGQITVTLTGAASLAAYQAAIQAVTFQNTSNQPSTEARVIQVTVNDGFLDSNTAVTTVNVVSVNDAPSAENDTVITNVAAGSPFLVPEWALLANDSDPEGAALRITNASIVSGSLTAVSLTQNPRSVTVTDNTTANGTFSYTVNDGSGAANATDTATVTVNRVTSTALNGTTAANIMIGNDLANTIDAGQGNDTVFGGGGNDTIVWNVDTNFFGNETGNDGRDFVDGGAGTLDRFVVNGGPNAETFTVYARAEAIAAGFTDLKADTEIVITRRVGNTTSVIAELDNIEEITINTGPGNDTVRTVGDFSPTSLNFNTITINGTGGDDTVDITSLQSAHRIYFRSNGGNDTIVGTLRPQDVVELPNGAVPGDYEVTTDDNGVTTMTRDGHKLTFVCEDGLPQFGSDDEEETPPGNGGDTGSNDDEEEVENPGDDNGSGDDDDGSCGHDDDEDAGSGDDGGVTPPPMTQPGPTVGAPIAGTNGTEVLVGTAAGETIMALDGNDNVVAGAGNDIVNGGNGNDFLSGEAGRDVMFGGDGDDNMLGGADADMLYGDAGNDRIFGDDGNDMIDAGAGNDTVYGGAGNDLIVASAGDGNDVYYGDDMTGGTGTDTLDMSAITANITANLGGNGASYGTVTSSQSGTDTIWGIENIVTGSGNDVITASRAVNVIDGGAGNDVFRFLSAEDANGDTILGFQPGDRIDLSAIDANGGAAGKQAFTLANGSSFTGPAQLVISHETRADGDYTVVSGNTTGPDAAEFKISLKGNHDLKASDFVLS
ncbi:peroxidase family protein [Microvirga calopogonii]|uniref:peroxidase family protein n=1 Tax=Microvirga calopogonii TaxID=2078013 RepID=UPI000E0D6BA8|nr:peroxidase family protein [Microvirga calopogonii]